MEKCVEVIGTLNSVLLGDVNVVIDPRPLMSIRMHTCMVETSSALVGRRKLAHCF